ncbi:hypothetical protein TSUD_221170 [Trifolium subterraneum]|uniref:Uncharacterized protein n=1 Tax=Trifolium subterraneum TaxID=3900 RepID=A0A2Z6NQA4_TRISU|nr:hypothetical protein TSUD_221170 [Trifolium subterraneum]
MENAENTFPSSKKRAAEHELSRDTPNHKEKDSRYLATGTYRETVTRKGKLESWLNTLSFPFLPSE